MIPLLHFLIAIVLSCVIISPYLDARITTLPALLAFTMPVLIGVVAAIQVCIQLKYRSISRVNIFLLLFVSSFHLPSYFSINAPQKQGNIGDGLVISSFNVAKYFTAEQGVHKVREKHVQELALLIDKHKIDVLTLQEDTIRMKESELLIGLSRMVHRCKSPNGSLTIYSVFALSDCRYDSYGNTVNGILSSTARVGGKDINLINFHLPRTKLETECTIQWSSEKAGLAENISEMANRLRIFSSMIVVRETWAQKIIDQVIDSHSRQLPSIVAGDLNDVPMSRSVYLLKQRLNDVFREVGHGWGGTYLPLANFFRIDYIFASKDADLLFMKSIKTGFSDHKMLVASTRI